MLVTVEEAAGEARERCQSGERDDEAEEGALADHAASPFGEGSTRGASRVGSVSRVVGDCPAHVFPRSGGWYEGSEALGRSWS